MRKIKVINSGVIYPNIIEVTDETYKIIERKVIESVTDTVEKQILLKETKITLPMLMETCITETMVHEAITESINDIKNKKI
jgi:hypothetical protein